MNAPSFPIDLDAVAADIRVWCRSLEVPGAPVGTYRFEANGEPTLYASAEMAMIRWIIGDDLAAMPDEERSQWADVINSRQDPSDGHYESDMGGHSVIYTNGAVINALNVLGKKHRHPVRLYSDFNTADTVKEWISSRDWSEAWTGSHDFWGGVVPWSHSAQASPEWRRAVDEWLEENFDPHYGSWPKGCLDRTKHRLTPVGSAIHLYPYYRHHGRKVPGADVLAGQILEWQHEDGGWGEADDPIMRRVFAAMDSLYVLAVAAEQSSPETAEPLRAGARRYLELAHFGAHLGDREYFGSLHATLGWVSSLGYLQRMFPELFTSTKPWTNLHDVGDVFRLDTVRCATT